MFKEKVYLSYCILPSLFVHSLADSFKNNEDIVFLFSRSRDSFGINGSTGLGRPVVGGMPPAIWLDVMQGFALFVFWKNLIKLWKGSTWSWFATRRQAWSWALFSCKGRCGSITGWVQIIRNFYFFYTSQKLQSMLHLNRLHLLPQPIVPNPTLAFRCIMMNLRQSHWEHRHLLQIRPRILELHHALGEAQFWSMRRIKTRDFSCSSTSWRQSWYRIICFFPMASSFKSLISRKCNFQHHHLKV